MTEQTLEDGIHCPVCLATRTAFFGRGTDFLFETSEESFTLRSCGDCRCLFLEPMPSADEIAGFYPPAYWWQASGAGWLARLEGLYRRVVLVDHLAFIRRAARCASPSERASILDVGCGPATVLGILKQEGFRVHGVDASPRAAEVARRDYGVEVSVGTLEEVDLPPASFDTAVLLHVLEHVPNPGEVLAAIGRVLKDSGRLVLQVPNIDSIQFRLFGIRWYGLDVPRHLIDYSRQAVLGLLADSGFYVERVRHFNLRDNAPALASSMFPALDPVSRAVRAKRRNASEARIGTWVRHLAYLALVMACYPAAALEALLGRGATLMIQARKR